MGLKSYLRTNWGAPFIIIFMILLIASASELSYGLNDAANETAVYAFYFLVAGVALQIASYIKYGEEEHKEQIPIILEQPEKKKRNLKKYRILIAIVLVALIASIAFIAVQYNPIGTVFKPSYPPLQASKSFSQTIKEPDGSVVVVVGVSVFGGNLPYMFEASWSDGFNQTSSTGVFQRTFQNNTILPSSVIVTVRSSDGQSAKVHFDINSTS